MSQVTINITERTEDFEIATMPILHGEDTIFVCNGKDASGQLWQWVEVRRRQSGAPVFTMSICGMARIDKPSRVVLRTPKPYQDPKMPNENRRKAINRQLNRKEFPKR